MVRLNHRVTITRLSIRQIRKELISMWLEWGHVVASMAASFHTRWLISQKESGAFTPCSMGIYWQQKLAVKRIWTTHLPMRWDNPRAFSDTICSCTTSPVSTIWIYSSDSRNQISFLTLLTSESTFWSSELVYFMFTIIAIRATAALQPPSLKGVEWWMGNRSNHYGNHWTTSPAVGVWWPHFTDRKLTTFT